MSPPPTDDRIAEFPTPPREFTDAEDRTVTVRRADAEDKPALLDMYADFHPEDRAQSVPPIRPEAIRDWIDDVVAEDCLNVVAWHDENAIGHAMLVPDSTGDYELAIFVLRPYQGALIGTELVRSLLGWGREAGIDRVWLTVERWNDPAIRLYEKVGFETTESQNFELEMEIRLDQTESTG